VRKFKFCVSPLVKRYHGHELDNDDYHGGILYKLFYRHWSDRKFVPEIVICLRVVH